METLHLLRKRPWGIAGALIILVIILTAILAPAISSYQPNQIDLRNTLQPPGDEFILGNDNLGRDVFTLLVYGARPYVVSGLIATGLSLVLGLVLGIISAKAGGLTDSILRRVVVLLPILPALGLLFLILNFLLNYVAVFLPFPIRVGLVIQALVGDNRWTLYGCITLFISLVFLPAVYRAVRAAFSPASSGQGLRPLVPLTPVIFGAAIGLAVIFIAWAGFHGFGLPPGIPEWGSALSGSGRQYLATAPWIARPYLIAIVVSMVGAVLFMQATGKVWFPRIAAARSA